MQVEPISQSSFSNLSLGGKQFDVSMACGEVASVREVAPDPGACEWCVGQLLTPEVRAVIASITYRPTSAAIAMNQALDA